MPKFDPKEKREAGRDEAVPAGDYLLAIRSFQRKNGGQSKSDYLRCRFGIIAGPLKGKSFFDSVSLDTTNSGSMFRLALLAEGCGRVEPFDTDSDAEMREAFVDKPFKARVSRKPNGQYVNNGIERYLIADKDVTQREREIMETWLLELQEQSEMGMGDGGPPMPTDDDYGSYERSGRGKGDDEIPF